MCVILAAVKNQRPTREMVEQAWEKNDDGGGIAWRERLEDNSVIMKWKKNLTKDQMIEMCGSLPLPYIAHFRIASSGGIRPELCHPFPISNLAPRTVEGESKDEYVLFHNGDWRDWQDLVLKAAVDPRAPELPGGKWNDTRAMSWLCSIYGIHFMDLIEHKGVAFSADDCEIFVGKDGWKEINGVWCSNDYFWKGPRNLTPGPQAHYSQMCKNRNCSEQKGLIQGYCEKHKEERSLRLVSTNGQSEKKDQDAMASGRSNVEGARVTDGDKSPSVARYNHKGQPKRKEVICQECRALLSVGMAHTAECSRSKLVIPGMVCSSCQVPAGRQHLTTCKVVSAGVKCAECKQDIKVPTDHYLSCSKHGENTPLPVVPGGVHPTDPFHVLLTAAKAWKDGKLSKQELKIVKCRLGFKHQPTNNIEELEKWAIAERRKEQLKDPRLEPVTRELIH